MFGAPATEPQVATVEAVLGVHLPEQLRQLYFECDGMQEDRGGASYLHTLSSGPAGGSLLASTQFLWKHQFEWPDMRSFVFFGRSSGDDNWGINWRKHGEIIAFHHHMQDEFEVVASDILDLFQSDYTKYEKLP